MIASAPLLVLGATLGTASGILALCGLSLLCKSFRKTEAVEGSTGVFQPSQQFSIQKSTEPVQPRSLLTFPRLYRAKAVGICPEMVNYTQQDESPSAEGPEDALTTPTLPHLPHSSINIPLHSRFLSSMSPAAALAEKKGKNSTLVSLCVSACSVGLPGMDQPDCMSPSDSPETPKLHFSLQYNTQSRELQVTIIEAEKVCTAQGSDCYVIGNLTTLSTRKEAKTTVKRALPQVVWQETLAFPLPEGCEIEGEMALSLYSCDTFSQHAHMGVVRFKLADVPMLSNADCWVDLQLPKLDRSISAGEILLSISYLPAANRLGVVVMKARGLQSDKMKDIIDLSVKLALKHQNTKLKKKQTRRVKHKINPVWNEMMMFEVPHELLSQSSLELEVLNQNQCSEALSLGQCSLGLQSIGSGLQHWQQMLSNPRRQIAMWHPLYA
ncbi:synaptotagmin-13 [Erpetoichthys calabaricus]|uniref:synaptotagmin-13 n=1 Tax=Erpetoichthys calabaricus TaxID=27687 RepID=UPI0022348534|nr:synaptotagmin-13 [Erpetoichthys calabaricus]